MTSHLTIEETIRQGLCCSCGLCVGVCAKGSISLSVNGEGILLPAINTSTCIKCGLCYKVCPGKDILDWRLDNKSSLVGNVKNAFTGHVCDKSFLIATASGGICSWMTKKLLDSHKYDCAFMVDTFNYSQYVKTSIYLSLKNVDTIGRSRYIPVSHEKAAEYILNHKRKRVIIVGTSCAIRGFRNLFRTYRLDEDNYLLIGLFCDKTMNYNVWHYFTTFHSSKLKSLFFRSKEKSGWPGDMKIVYDKETLYLPKTERSKVKDFFCNKRCLYCMDKLNVCSDISLGDNYTGIHTYQLGSSNILVRTERGEKTFESLDKEEIQLYELNIEDVYRSQEIKKKIENAQFLKLHLGERVRGNYKIKMKYAYKLVKIYIGDIYKRFSLPMKALIYAESIIKKK